MSIDVRRAVGLVIVMTVWSCGDTGEFGGQYIGSTTVTRAATATPTQVWIRGVTGADMAIDLEIPSPFSAAAHCVVNANRSGETATILPMQRCTLGPTTFDVTGGTATVDIDFHLRVNVLGQFTEASGQTYPGTISFAGSG